jgi:hypothetical protein
MGPQTTIEGLSGDAARRSFLLTFGEWRERQDAITKLTVDDITTLSEDEVAQLVRDTIVLQGNLAQLAQKCALELGLPIQ